MTTLLARSFLGRVGRALKCSKKVNVPLDDCIGEFFLNLSEDCRIYIISFLSVEVVVCKISVLNSYWRTIANHNIVWRTLLQSYAITPLHDLDLVRQQTPETTMDVHSEIEEEKDRFHARLVDSNPFPNLFFKTLFQFLRNQWTMQLPLAERSTLLKTTRIRNHGMVVESRRGNEKAVTISTYGMRLGNLNARIKCTLNEYGSAVGLIFESAIPTFFKEYNGCILYFRDGSIWRDRGYIANRIQRDQRGKRMRTYYPFDTGDIININYSKDTQRVSFKINGRDGTIIEQFQSPNEDEKVHLLLICANQGAFEILPSVYTTAEVGYMGATLEEQRCFSHRQIRTYSC